ncbi:MAG TPA: kelch repeat-containing protein [Steroidobacteraceae bacterium]|nr:kelch repeat-containing protein [Steroidobacteraceae bacterium]
MLIPGSVACLAITVLSGCGGSGGGPGVTTYQVNAAPATGGSIAVSNARVDAGSAATLNITANSGYTIGSVTGCDGTLTGSTYTTGTVTADCTVTASFIAQYTVTGTAGVGGTLSPASALVTSGATTTLTVTANSGYIIGSVTGCGGSLAGNTYTTGAVSANCTVTANFLAQYSVTATAVDGGTISPASAIVTAGSTTTFTVAATGNKGYPISSVTGCGGNLSGTTYTTGPITGTCAVTAAYAAPFTWVFGPNNGLLNGNYGTHGVPSATTVPGARNSSAAWMDASGNLWIFGGYGIDVGSGAAPDVMNDLWEYSPSSGQWTWWAGSNTVKAAGVYGTKGLTVATNMPGARQNAVTWTDSSGQVWLFGGTGYDSTGINLGPMNDLWVYSPTTGQWTWVGGSNTQLAPGVYGTQGNAASPNVPGARFAAVSWQDASGNLWLFGGWGVDASGVQGYLNDVWEYSLTSGNWTWVSGSTTAQAVGDYGSQAVAASANVPGARSNAMSWTDATGNLWVFGGMGLDSTGATGYLNDLWEFSPASGGWIWIGGSNTAQAVGVYGTEGVAAAANGPGGRRDVAGWTDAAGNLWLFGGWGLDSAGTLGLLNDLWEYSVSNNEWAWIKGSSTVNSVETHGTIGAAAGTNIPGARQEVTSVKDPSGIVWLFGGFGYGPITGAGELNDIWTYPTQ